jgi:hypothetical protein
MFCDFSKGFLQTEEEQAQKQIKIEDIINNATKYCIDNRLCGACKYSRMKWIDEMGYYSSRRFCFLKDENGTPLPSSDTCENFKVNIGLLNCESN